MMSEVKSQEQELEQLKLRQQQLQTQISELNKEKMSKQMEALSAAAKKREEEAEQERLVLVEIAKRRKEREEAERKEQERVAQEAAKERVIREQQALREKEERQQREAERERIKSEAEKTFQLEREAQRLVEEIARGFSITDDAKPVTLTSPEHPLSRIFGNRTIEETEILAKPHGLDSVEQARNQSASEAEASRLKAQSPWRPIRKLQRYVDSSSSYELEKLFRKELKMGLNSQRLDQLSAEWDYADLLKSAQIVISVAKDRAMSADSILAYVQSTLEEAAAEGDNR
jgi:hypothetical protein